MAVATGAVRVEGETRGRGAAIVVLMADVSDEGGGTVKDKGFEVWGDGSAEDGGEPLGPGLVADDGAGVEACAVAGC